MKQFNEAILAEVINIIHQEARRIHQRKRRIFQKVGIIHQKEKMMSTSLVTIVIKVFRKNKISKDTLELILRHLQNHFLVKYVINVFLERII